MEIKEARFYRTLKRLSYGDGIVGIGEFHALERCSEEAIVKLIERRCIAPIETPPLEQLPGWVRRAERFGELDVVNVAQLLATDTGALAEALSVRPSTVESWRAEALGWLRVPKKKRG